jgi:hypothetical protein
MPGDREPMRGQRHNLSTHGDKVPCAGKPVRDEGHGVPANRHEVPYDGGDALLSTADDLPSDRHTVSFDGNILLCGGSGGNALPAHGNAVSDGGDGLLGDRRGSADCLPRGVDKMPVGRDRLSTHADEMPTPVDQLRESPDGLSLVNSRYALHSTAESRHDRGRELERREWTFA